MSNNELKKLAEKIIELEKDCHNNKKNISKNIKQMESLMSNLNIVEMIKLAEYLDDSDLQF